MYLVVYCVAGALCVVDEVIHQTAEDVHFVQQLLHGVLVEIYALVRLHLTGYAADVLSAEYLAAVGAAIHIAGLSADDSADIVSDVRVTYGAVVLAALDYSV